MASLPRPGVSLPSKKVPARRRRTHSEKHGVAVGSSG
jgi:hypothetical protein